MLLTSGTTRDRQPRTCIIDPILALSPYGLPLIKQLRSIMELWVVRELWHILDNTNLYLQQAELITPRKPKISERERVAVEETIESLQEWGRFRLETDLAGLNLFWLGDSLRESFLPNSRNFQDFWHWESIAASLDAHLEHYQREDSILSLAFRDAVALTVSLESAFILTRQNSSDFLPEICQSLENWRIPCEMLTPDDSVVTIERDYLRQLFVSTGLTRFLWAEIHLCVLHLATSELSFSRSPWSGVRGFWYVL